MSEPLDIKPPDQARAEAAAAGRELSVLQRIAATVGRSLELKAVVDFCIDLTRELTGADFAALYLLDEAAQHLTLAAGNVIPLPGDTGVLPRSVIDRFRASPSPVILPVDGIREPYRAACVATGVTMTMTVPLLVRSSCTGIVALGFRSMRPFSRSTIDTLVAMAEQQAMAIDFARGQEINQLRARYAEVLRDVAERALAALTDEDTYEALLDGVVGILGRPHARLAVIDGDGALRTERARNLPPELLALAPLGPGDAFVARLHAASAPLVYGLDGNSGSPWEVALRNLGMRSTVVLPLRLRGKLVGALSSASPRSGPLHAEQLSSLGLLSSVAASAVEARRQRHAAEQERARLGQILEDLPLPVVVLDQQSRFEQVNAAYRAVNPSASIGGSWAEAMRQLEYTSSTATPYPTRELAVERALRGEANARSDLRVKVDGGWRNLVTHANVLRRPSGEFDGLVAAIQDVTALRELADAKDRFLDIASHELRSPLSALSACTSLLEIDPTAISDEGRRRQLTARILRQVDRLVLLLDELVEMSRIRGGTLRLSPSRTDLAEVAREVADLLQLQTDKHHIHVQAAAPVEGMWDRQRIAQVATNLMSNAARYSPAGGDIFVRVWADGDHASLAVEDQGIGIPAEEQARLFEPYFRGPSAGQVARSGLGLGLYISMEIVRHHRGTIEVESQPGRGSRFTVRLPREAAR